MHCPPGGIQHRTQWQGHQRQQKYTARAWDGQWKWDPHPKRRPARKGAWLRHGAKPREGSGQVARKERGIVLPMDGGCSAGQWWRGRTGAEDGRPSPGFLRSRDRMEVNPRRQTCTPRPSRSGYAVHRFSCGSCGCGRRWCDPPPPHQSPRSPRRSFPG
jgi:hypothetical protein